MLSFFVTALSFDLHGARACVRGFASRYAESGMMRRLAKTGRGRLPISIMREKARQHNARSDIDGTATYFTLFTLYNAISISAYAARFRIEGRTGSRRDHHGISLK